MEKLPTGKSFIPIGKSFFLFGKPFSIGYFEFLKEIKPLLIEIPIRFEQKSHGILKSASKSLFPVTQLLASLN